MSQDDIRNALRKHLYALDNNFPTAYENVKYEPTANTPYQSISTNPLTPDNPTFGDDFHRENGFFQVILCYPTGQGTASIASKAELIKTHFKRTTTLIENDTEVVVDRTPYIGSGYVAGDRYCVPIRISYYANIC